MTLESGVITLGRSPDVTITLDDALVSRRHAELRVEAAGAAIIDLGSANGTVVDGAPLLPHQPRLLTDGARIHIGPFEMIYRATRPSADESEWVPADEPFAETAAEPTAAAPATPDAIEPPPPTAPRPTFAAPTPEGPPSRYILDLPVIYADSDFLSRFLLIFEALWEPLERRQDHIGMYFDPRTSPAGFLPWLASWLDVSFNVHWPEARRRRLLSEAMDLYRWRGTRYGLTRMIEVCAGVTPEITDSPQQPFVFEVRVRIPTGVTVERDLIEELIRQHKPAHTGFRLEFLP